MAENEKRAQYEQDKADLKRLYMLFNQLFPSIETIWHELLHIALARALIFCKRCHCTKFVRHAGTRKGTCLSCGKKQSLTAGSFLKNIRVPAAWLFLQWLTAQGYLFSAQLIHNITGVAQSSISHIEKSIAAAVGGQPNEASVVVKSVMFQQVISHRSRETPRGMHPQDEELNFDSEEEVHEQPELESRLSSLDHNQILIAKMLSDEPMHCDKLTVASGLPFPVVASCLTILEMEDLAVRLPGDRYILKKADSRYSNSQSTAEAEKSKLPPDKAASVSLFEDLMRDKFSGVSRKCLQLYLNLFWCFIDRRWTYAELSRTCFSAGYIGGRSLLNTVSPQDLSVPYRQQLAQN